MEDNIRRKLDKFKKGFAFMDKNAVDFPAGSPGADATQVHSDIIDEIKPPAVK